jgi:hypothetical protein
MAGPALMRSWVSAVSSFCRASRPLDRWAGNIKAAEALVEKLCIAPALERRFRAPIDRSAEPYECISS